MVLKGHKQSATGSRNDLKVKQTIYFWLHRLFHPIAKYQLIMEVKLKNLEGEFKPKQILMEWCR